MVANLTPEQFSAELGRLAVGGARPGRVARAAAAGTQAMINALLEAAPVPVREALFAGFLSPLQRPTF